MNGLPALHVMILMSMASVSACVVVEDDNGPARDPGTTGTDADPGSGDSGSGSLTEPASGVWHYTEFTPIGNDCDLSDRYGDDGEFALVNHGDRTFTVEPDDGTDAFDCSMDGDDFDCPDRASASEDFSSQGIAAVLHVQARAAGTFSSSASASGRQEADVSCTGADCALAELAVGSDLPCTFQVDFEVDLVR